MKSLFVIITTIQSPTASMRRLVERLSEVGGTMVVAGDRKGPEAYAMDAPETRLQFLSLDTQLSGPFDLARRLPTGHYSRKNIAYLHAIAQGARCIYETDDDNAPLTNWAPRDEYLREARWVPGPDRSSRIGSRWINVYRYFTDALIWPRGLPLDAIHAPVPETVACTSVRAPIQQGLVNNSPDVDAIWRLAMDRPFAFDDRESVCLAPGNWSPFNTQSTWWWPVVYPLLYIPSYCSFRMCDIWKSFVAQRCLWALGHGVAFHAPEVAQERNAHDLMRDFRDEVPGYSNNREIADVLLRLDLVVGEDAVSQNLQFCYEALAKAGFVDKKELILVSAWIGAIQSLTRSIL